MIKTTSNYNKPPSPTASSTVCQDRKKIKYQPLSSEEGDQVNIYGVIIDAAYPVQSGKGKWICSLKVIDNSLHTTGDERNQDFQFAVIIIYANRFEECPIVRQIGDIIRVHRANMKMYKGRRQYNVNVNFNASWSLFETNPKHALKGDDSASDAEMADEGVDGEGAGCSDYEPYKFSSKHYSLDMSVHKSICKGLRKWTIKYLAENMVVHASSYTSLSKIQHEKRGKDIDLLVKVLKIHEKDEQTVELRIKDVTSTLWFLNLPKLRFGSIMNIRQGEIIRVRSVIQDLTSRRKIITHKPTTNILKFLPTAKIVARMQEQIQDMNDTDRILLEDSSEVLMSPVQLTEVTEVKDDGKTGVKTELGAPYRLQDLFLNFDTFPREVKERNTFYVRFCVYRIEPSDPREIVVAACPKCHDTTSCKDLPEDGTAKCKACNVPTKLIFQMQMLVKDTASQLNKNFYRVLLYTFDQTHGGDFFGMKPTNLYKNEKECENITRYLQMMMRFNVWIDAELERRNQFFIIKDTRIKSDF